MNLLVQTLLLSMTPLGELRLGIPWGLAHGGEWPLVLLAGIAGNMLVVPLLFLFLEYVHTHLLHVGAYQTLFDRQMERVRHKTQHHIEKYGVVGLALFVAIPLPLTGAYTGALAAWFFGMNLWKAFWSILAGVCVAGGLVTLVVKLGLTAFEFALAA